MLEDAIRENFPVLASDRKLLEELMKEVSIKVCSSGETLIDYGAYIKFVPLVLKGAIKIMRENDDGKEVLLYYLSAGDSCAASFTCCLIQKRSEVKAVCAEDSEILMIPLNTADRWMGKYSSWRNFILTMYDQRLFNLIDTIDKLAFSKLDEKLMDYLLESARIHHSNWIKASHQEIAHDLNVSREAISRLLKKLEQEGSVQLERNKIKLTGDLF